MNNDTQPAPLEGIPSQCDSNNGQAARLVEFEVELEVVGRLWWPTWIGHARDSKDATRQAEAWFYGQFQGEPAIRKAYPLRARSVVQLPEACRA